MAWAVVYYHGLGMGMPRVTVIAAVPRLFCVLKLLLSVISAFILFFPTN
jgi:hypothetical protein